MTAPQPDYVQTGMTALATTLAGRTTQAAVRAHLDRETALLRLACVAPPHTLETIVCPEIGRRATILGSEPDAIESVYQDLTTGRWQP